MNISASLQSTYLWIRGILGCYLIPLLVSVILFSPVSHSSEVFTATLVFETEGLDLDTGTVIRSEIPGEADGSDIRMAYNALRSPVAVVMSGVTEGIELAFVSEVAFDGVTADSLADLTFSAKPLDASFSAADTVVVRTDTGALFKLGNASESDTGITFSYAAL